MTALGWTRHALVRLKERYGADSAARSSVETELVAGRLAVETQSASGEVTVMVFALGSTLRLVLDRRLRRVITVLPSAFLPKAATSKVSRRREVLRNKAARRLRWRRGA